MKKYCVMDYIPNPETGTPDCLAEGDTIEECLAAFAASLEGGMHIYAAREMDNHRSAFVYKNGPLSVRSDEYIMASIVTATEGPLPEPANYKNVSKALKKLRKKKAPGAFRAAKSRSN